MLENMRKNKKKMAVCFNERFCQIPFRQIFFSRMTRLILGIRTKGLFSRKFMRPRILTLFVGLTSGQVMLENNDFVSFK